MRSAAARLVVFAAGLALVSRLPAGDEGPGQARTGLDAIRVSGDAFFVLGSDYPVRIAPGAVTAGWLRVEPLDAARLDPRVVAIRVDASRPPGPHEAAFRVDVFTAEGREPLWLAVELCPAPGCPGRTPRQGPPARFADPGADIRSGTTPGGHLLVEIVDRERERREIGEARARAGEEEPGREPRRRSPAEPPPPAPAGFQLVLPWMCLEYPCGSSTAADVADAAKGRDAINAVSYERYTMRDGAVRLHPVGDPGPWAQGLGLGLWPMLTGGTEASPAAIQAMWQSRDAIAAELLSEARSRGYAGYCLDVEGRADPATAATFLELVSHLADRLHLEGRRLMVATATWSTIAPFEGLARSSADFVASMDPYTSLWRSYVPANYASVEPARLVWGFTWDRMPRETQLAMWEWMQAGGFNQGVAGAAVWRTPLTPPHPGNDLDYYEALRTYYPARRH